jgi:hypothetical protein
MEIYNGIIGRKITKIMNFIFKPDVHYTIPTLKTSKDIQNLNLTTIYKTDSLTEYSLALDSVINKKYVDTSVSIGVKYRF